MSSFTSDPADIRHDIYAFLSNYFATAVRELALDIPRDDPDIVAFLLPAFAKYSAGAQTANRLLSYVNRHYVKRAMDEDRGWFRLADILEPELRAATSDPAVAKRIRELRDAELKKWGWPGPPHEFATAQACAEAASSADAVVPVLSLAYRCFRTELIEPLLAVHKSKTTGRGKHSTPKTPSGPPPVRSRSRLARTVDVLLRSENCRDDATQLQQLLRTVGIRREHTVVKRLDAFLATT